MPKRVNKNKSIFTPLTENFIKRVSTSDDRTRRRIVRYSLVLFGVFLLYSIFSGTFGIRRIIKLELEKNTLVETNRIEMAKLIDAGQINQMLKSDNSYIEYIARTRYHMVYPGETIYRYRGQ
jgi:cell division protein FtsB